jgi:non-reducing end alpha-L-arabinofuranosidase
MARGQLEFRFNAQNKMKTKTSLVVLLASALTLPVAALLIAKAAGAGAGVAPNRPEGPCDIYAAGGSPCVAAHSTTRALYASYNGPLYQILRQSDGKTLDIGVVPPTASPVDAGGYANAAAQDAFCSNTYCWITTIYDQSGKGNHLTQPPRGGFSGPAMGGFDNVPVADWAPVTIMGHKVYGVFIAPGMGMRIDDAKGTAVDDQAEGQYWVINGLHFNDGCCFDYGNAETDSRDDDNGTMETAYYGNSTGWYHGPVPGPWVMTDQENNLVGCVNPNGSKNCPDLPTITWRFVTAMAKGEPHHWTSMGGDAQTGALRVMFDGPRINNTYDPMRKQGAILLGNGGDNSNGSEGTFYEGAMTAANTFPTDAVDQKVQANVVAAHYDSQRLTVAPASAGAKPPGLQTFAPGSLQDTTVTFKNTSGAAVTGLKLSLTVPADWTSVLLGGSDTFKTFANEIGAGASVSATFRVKSGPTPWNGDLVGNALWMNTMSGQSRSDTIAEKVRNVSPVKINEFAVGSGTPANATDSFIELYNAGDTYIDISGWSLTEHASQQAVFSSVKIPNGATLAAHGFYLLGLANSGLAVPAHKGDAQVYVRSTAGMSVGDTIEIDTGSAVETRKITSLGTQAGNTTTVWQPLPDGPVITVPPGSTNLPVTGTGGITVGEKIALGYGATYPAVANTVEKYEVVEVTSVGKAGLQSRTATQALAGATNIKVMSVNNISVGDKIRLDIDSVGHGIETVTVTHVGTATGRGGQGTGLDIDAPLKFTHAANMPFSARGTGISFQPASKEPHSSNEPLQPLGTGITLDSPLANDHPINAVAHDAAVTTAGYQGKTKPNVWFGGPALSGAAGSMVLHDAAGLVVDSLNYGLLVDPWASEGYQADSGAGIGGCYVAAPGGRGGRGGGPAPNRSAGRFPDGNDTDSNCRDFLLQAGNALAVETAAGANSIKLPNMEFSGGQTIEVGQTIYIDGGENYETAIVQAVGTAGGTKVGTATVVGATIIPVGNAAGFRNGQTITIGSGANVETATIASISGGGRGGRGGNRGGANGGAATVSITVSSPLTLVHEVGAPVSGSGITLASALTKAHEAGATVAGGVPTPGATNQYSRRPAIISIN